MRIGGFQRFSLIDYPEKISAIIFTQGCNFRCPYCHNPELVYPEFFNEPIAEEEVFSFLKKRMDLIDGVVITGGEPLLQSGLKDFLMHIKQMGYSIKLDTNGSLPQKLKELLKNGLLDYIAMDYKGPLGTYRKIVRVEINPADIRRSLELVIRSGIQYEMRTTVFNGLSLGDLIEMMMELQSFCVKNYFLQMFVPWPGCRKDLSPRDINTDYLFQNLMHRFWRYGIRNLKEEQYHYGDNRRKDKCN
ncbi:MAG: anaerobic ribonucleoside-triphosphate reductase activating protein [Nitrospirae bacterium]|nr:anaerobic ribonucleoside-triphosphate reductase activating protein [Nitrospirota bacterium]